MQRNYVSFKQAKLLKEKEFGLTENCYIQLHSFYEEDGSLTTSPSTYKRNISKGYLGALTIDNVEVGITQGLDNSLDGIYLAPEQWLLTEWLRVNHGLWVTVYADTDRKFQFGIDRWDWYELEKCERVGSIVLGEAFFDTISGAFDSPQDAYSAAFDFILDKLI